MESSLKAPELSNPKDNSSTKTTLASKEIAGKITSHIGSGRNAKDSFIWMTITWSFYVATGMSILLFLRFWCGAPTGEDLLDSITKIWGVFVPIITLALGYAFGKGE